MHNNKQAVNIVELFCVVLKSKMSLQFYCGLFVILSMQIALAKQTLKHDYSFSGSDTEVGRSSIERGRKAEERINLSFPGNFPK